MGFVLCLVETGYRYIMFGVDVKIQKNVGVIFSIFLCPL